MKYHKRGEAIVRGVWEGRFGEKRIDRYMEEIVTVILLYFCGFFKFGVY